MINHDLNNKTALVTGANGKLGPIWCQALLKVGASVIAVDLNDSNKSNSITDLIDKYGSDRFKSYTADVLDRDSLQDLKNKIELDYEPVSILVNNAGIDKPPEPGRTFTIDNIPEDDFLPLLNVNLYGAFLVSQVFGIGMVQRETGSIINIGSLYGEVSPDPSFYNHIECDPPFIKPPAYAVSKAGLLQLTKYLAAHWGARGVRVNALSPGGVEGNQDEKFKMKFCSRVPLKKMAQPEDLEGPLIFLASDASSYITGHNLQVNGGFTVW